MASKDEDFDLDDWGDLDANELDFNFDVETPAIPTGREALLQTPVSAAKGALGAIAGPGKRRDLVLKALPKEYTVAADAYDNLASTGQEIYSHAKDEMRKTGQQLKYAGRAVLPIAKPFLPKSISDKLTKAFAAEQSWGNEYNPNDAAMAAGMESVFGQQSAGMSREDAQGAAEDFARDKLEEKVKEVKQDRIYDVIGKIGRNVEEMTVANRVVGTSWKKKMLELSFRQYFTQADLLKTTAESNQKIVNSLEAIVKNTALPDYAKEEFGEVTAAMMKRKVIEVLSPANFGRNYFRLLGDSVRSKISDFFGGVSDIAGVVAMGGEMMEADNSGEELTPEQRRAQLGQTVARQAGAAFANKWITPQVKKAQEKARAWGESNEGVANFGGRAANILTTLPERLNAYANDPSRDGGEGAILKPILKFASQFGPSFYGERANFEGYNADSLGKSTGWSKRESVTLNEIIPGYLARIDRSVRQLRDPGAELETFDFNSRSFRGIRNVATALNKQFSNKRTKEYQRKDIDKAIDEILGHDESGYTDEKDRENLRKLLESQALKVTPFDTRSLGKNYEEYGNVDGTNLMNLFSRISEDKLKANALDTKINMALGRVRSMTGRSQDELNNASSLYGTDVLKMAKVLNVDEEGRAVFNRKSMDIWSDFDELDPHVPIGPSSFGAPLAAPPRSQRGGANQMGRFDAQTIKEGMRMAFWGVEPTLRDTIVSAIELARKRGQDAKAERDALGQAKEGQGSVLDNILAQLKEMNVAPRIDEIIEAIHGVATSNIDPEKFEEYFKNKKGAIRSFFGKVWKQGRVRFKMAKRTGNRIRKSVWDSALKLTGLNEEGSIRQAFTKAKDTVIGGFVNIKDGLLGERNIYDEDGNIVLYGRLIKAGTYYTKDGKKITSIKDLSGGVYSETGEPIISEEEMVEKLGKLRYWSGKGWEFLSTAPGAIAAKVREGAGVASRIQKFIRSSTTDLLKSAYNQITTGSDIYVKGQMETPRLHRNLMVKGWYVSEATGKPIRKGSDIDGPVITKHKEPIITAQELADPNFQLVDADGQPLKTRWDSIKSRMTALVKTPFELGGKVLRGLGRGLSFAKDMGASIWETMFGSAEGKETRSGGMIKRFLSGQNAVTDRLDKIYTLLDERLKAPRRRKGANKSADPAAADADGDGVRDNSFLDILKRRRDAWKEKQAAKREAAGEDPKEKKDGFFGKLLSAGGAVLGIGKMLATGFVSVVGAFFKNTLGAFLINLVEKIGLAKAGAKAADVLSDAADLADNARDGTKGAKTKAGKYGRGVLGRLRGVGAGILEWGSGLLGRGGATAAAAATAEVAGGAAAGAAGAGLWGTLGSAAAWGIRGAVTLAAGAAASPWVLGATIAYFGYKYLKRKTSGPLDQMRFAQYGSTEYGRDDLDDAGILRYLEDNYSKYVSFDNHGVATIRGVDGAVSDEIAQGAGVDLSNEEKVTEWNRWFHGRFLPVYLLWSSRVRQNAPEAKLSELGDNDKVRYDVQERIAIACTLDAGHPMFNIDTGPLPESSTLLNGEEVDAVQKNTLSDLGKMKGLSLTTDKKDLVKDGQDLSKESEVSHTGDTTVNKPKSWLSELTAGVGEALGFKEKERKTIAGGVNVIGAAIERNGREVDGQVDALTAVRLRAYGVIELKTYQIDQIYRLEDILIKDITRQGKMVEYKGNLESQIEVGYRIFGIMRSNEEARNEYEQWFKLRFFPVFMNYLTVFYRYVPNGDPFLFNLNQFSGEAFDIASGIIATKTTLNGQSTPIWAIDFSPWKKTVVHTMAQITEMVNANMRYLDKLRKAKTAAEQAQSTEKKLPKAVASVKSKAWGKPKGMTDEQYKATPKGVADSIFSDLEHSANDPTFQGGPSGGGAEFSGFDYSMGAMSEIGEGSGSYADLRKYPVGGGNQDIVNMITAAAGMTGMDPGLMLTVAQMESSLDPKAGASTSSAKGLYQFINDTWKEVVGKYGNAYGLPKNVNVFDPWANTLMGAEYLKEGAKKVMGTLGRPATPVDLYLTHFLGGGGGSKFLKNMANNPNAIAARDFPSQAAANQKVFLGNGRPLTYAEVYDNLQRRARTGFAHVSKYTSGDIGKVNGEVSKPLSDVNDELKSMTTDNKGVPLATNAQKDAAEVSMAKQAGTQAATKAAAFTTPGVNPGNGNVSAWAGAAKATEVAEANQGAAAAARTAATSVELAKIDVMSTNVNSTNATLKAAQTRGVEATASISQQQLDVQKQILTKLGELHALALQRTGGSGPVKAVAGSDVVRQAPARSTFEVPRGIIPGK